MRRRPSLPSFTLSALLALVAAVTTALALFVPAFTSAAADAGARSVLAGRSGAETGADIGLPASGDPNALVRQTIAATFPAAAGLTATQTRTAGLIDVGTGRGYLASLAGDEAALPLASGRWPAEATEAALPVSAAEALGISAGDTLDLAGTRVVVTGVWASSPAAADRWFGVRAAFADGGGQGPIAVSPSVLDAVASSARLASTDHWTAHLDPAGLDLASLQESARAARALPDALAAAGIDTADLQTAGALTPTAQLAASRAAVLHAAEPVALSTALIASLGVTALLAALLVGAGAAERRIRWARGQAAVGIVGVDAVRALVPGLAGAIGGAVASAVIVTPPLSFVPAAILLTLAGSLAPAVLVAALSAHDVRALTRAVGTASAARLWTAGVMASVAVVLTVVASVRLMALGSTLSETRTGTSPDPIAVVAPASLLLVSVVVGTAAPLLATRALRERRAGRGGIVRYLLAMSAARRPLAIGASVVIVASAVGQLGFAAMYQGTWDAAYRTALAVQEGTAHRVASSVDDLTPTAVERLAALPSIDGVAPVWSANTSIAARSASLVLAAPPAVAALGDPAIPDLTALVDASAAEIPGVPLASSARRVEVDVSAPDATASASALVLLDDWGRVDSVDPDVDGAFTVPPVSRGPGGAWRIAAVEIAIAGAKETGAVVTIAGVRIDGASVDLGSAVVPVDVTTDALELQPDPGPPAVAVDSSVSRVRFVFAGAAPPVVVSRAFADAAGVAEGDILPLTLVAGAPSRATRISAVVPAVPGAPLRSAVFADARAVVSERLRVATALPAASALWLSIDDGAGVDAAAAALPDGAWLAGTAADDGHPVLSTIVTLLWCGAAAAAVLALCGLLAATRVVRRGRAVDVSSLRAIGVGAAQQRRLRLVEANAGVAAGAVVGVVACGVTGVLLLPAVVTGALPRVIDVAVAVDPLLAAGAGAVFLLAALVLVNLLALRDPAPRRGDQR